MTTIDIDAHQLRDALYRQLSAETAEAVRAIVAIAGARGGVFAVGGAVRDLLLHRPIVDIDLVTEADAIDVMREAFPDAHLTTHAAFRTASVESGETWIDVATARSETYARPGALPDVRPADIETDLRRRDFSMNAIALRLSGEPELFDPCHGVDDISDRRLRVLHVASFQDDATRLFRLFRYAARLGFGVDAATRALIDRDKSYVETIGGERLRREYELMLAEDTGGVALEAAAAAGLLATTHAALAWDVVRSAALREVTADARVTTGLAMLASSASVSQAEEIVDRLKLTRDEAAAVRGVAAMREVAAMLRRPDAKPSGVVVLLDRYPPASIAAFAATTDDAIAGQLARRYLDEWRVVKPILSGKDLIEMGIPAGPQIARGLQLLRAARLDGWVTDIGDERALMLRFAKSIRDSSMMRGDIEMRFHAN